MGEDSNNNINNNNKEEETTSSNGELLVVVTAAEETTTAAAEAWGTLEELLLVCAVNRHGSKSWDSISTELQKRRRIHNHNNNHHHSTADDVDDDDGVFSADDCRRKYVDLIRRYTAGVKTFSGNNDDGDGEREEEGEEEEEEEEEKLLRIVEELRKLRVEQLKREVHKHDVSIVSLQKKVKRLEEDNNNNKNNSSSTSSSLLLKPPEIEPKPEPSDLRIEPDQNANKTDLLERSSPEKRLGVDSAEDRSVNESNSSKADPKVEQDPVQMKTSRLGESASESKRDDSNNNNNNNNNNNKIITSAKLQQQQQSSDVQSSASLSKKKRRRFRVGGGVNSSGDDELEAEELSPANKRISVKSQPLIRFLDLLRSHKHGSVFHRRLPSQDTEKYRNVVRQHMDLDMVQWRLERGIYSECHHKFYRDLILIFTNAVLFYRKSSAEHIAARELRKLVIEESALRTRKPEPQPTKPDPEPQHLEPVVKKPRTASTMVVCRRRSSIQGLSDSLKKKEEPRIASGSTKNSNASNKLENGREEKPKIAQLQKKSDGGGKSINDFTSRIEKEGDKVDGVANSNSKKVLTKERSSLGRGTLRLSDNNGKKIISKDGNSKREKMGSSEGEGDDSMEKKKVNVDQKQEKASTTVLKKQGVANFLKRMKQNSPSSQEKAKSNDSDDQEVENGNKVGKKGKMDSSNNSNGKKTGGNVKKNSGKKDVDVVVTRRSSGRRGEKEAATSGRAIGRPPKRKAAMMGGGTPDSAKGGRSGGRDGGEKTRKKARR